MPTRIIETSSSRLVPLHQLLVAYSVYSLIAWLNVQFVFDWVKPLAGGSAGQRLAGAYLPHAILLVVVVGILILGWGKLRGRELGFAAGGWRIGLIGTVVFWLTMNSLYLLQVWQSGTEVKWNSQFANWRWMQLLVDLLVTQVIGNALLEEIVFRGYFFQQLESRLVGDGATCSRLRRWTGVFVAGVISVILFVALHLPIRLDAGIVGADLASNLLRVAVWGVLFTVLFVWTRNLWLVIGIHAITNRPGLWIDAGGSARIVQIAVAVLFITAAVVWSLKRKTKKKAGS